MTFATTAGPRERAIEQGIEALGDAELIALVLGTGDARQSVHVMASTLLDECGGLGGLARVGIGGLASRGGIGCAKGGRLAAAMELGRRVAIEQMRGATAEFPRSRAVDGWARPRIASLDHEELWILALDGRNKLRAARRVASGGLHGLHVAKRDPLRIALREGASAFILAHNHPSGDPTPSADDIEFTDQLARAASIVGAPLLDHIVVARDGYVSMLESGLFHRTKGGA